METEGDSGDSGDEQDSEGRRTSHFNAYLYLIQAIYMNMKANTATSLRDSMQIQLPKSKEEQLWETEPCI